MHIIHCREISVFVFFSLVCNDFVVYMSPLFCPTVIYVVMRYEISFLFEQSNRPGLWKEKEEHDQRYCLFVFVFAFVRSYIIPSRPEKIESIPHNSELWLNWVEFSVVWVTCSGILDKGSTCISNLYIQSGCLLNWIWHSLKIGGIPVIFASKMLIIFVLLSFCLFLCLCWSMLQKLTFRCS